jgi:hypothetical protein
MPRLDLARVLVAILLMLFVLLATIARAWSRAWGAKVRLSGARGADGARRLATGFQHETHHPSSPLRGRALSPLIALGTAVRAPTRRGDDTVKSIQTTRVRKRPYAPR